MNHLDPVSRALLASAAGCHEPTAADRVRIRHRLAARLGVAAGLGTLGTFATQTASAVAATAGNTAAKSSLLGALWGSTKVIAVSKLVGIALVSGAAGVGGYRLIADHRDLPAAATQAAATTHTNATPVRQQPAPSPTASAAEPTAARSKSQLNAGQLRDGVAVAQLAHPTADSHGNLGLPTAQARTQESVEARSEPASLPAVAAFPPDSPSLSAEARGLAAAQAELREGRADHALALLNQQSAQFTGGSLEEERSAARVVALCKSGDIAAGRSAAAAFLKRSPHSVLAARVANACVSQK